MSGMMMLTVDTGYSGTKTVVRISPTRPELLLMGPEVVEVSRESIDFYKSRKMTAPAPENEAWVEYKGTIYAVGFLAQNYFKGRVVIKEPKYEWAIAKVLAVVGVIVQREGLAEEIDLVLSIPLPYGEWEARYEFERDLGEALSQFSFRDQQLRVNLKTFICVPEGGGHAMMLGEKMGEAFNQQKILSLMWGYRDISPVLFNRGVHSGTTELLGFFRLIDLVIDRTFGNTSREREQQLIETIHFAGKDIKTKNFKHLALSKHPERKAREVEQITEAIKTARAEYWGMVTRFLSASIPDDTDAIIIGGGAASYYANELRSFLMQNYPNTRISWSAELEEDVRITFGLSATSAEDKALCARLTDAYGLSTFTRRSVYPYASQAIRN